MKEYPIYLLPDKMDISEKLGEKIIRDYERFGEEGLPGDLEEYLLEEYKIDVSAQYGYRDIKNPFGKASGQLSCTKEQVKADAEAGLGFVVLKTVIAQDQSQHSEMQEWKVNAPRMEVEEITGKRGRKGYTVTWSGRGWEKSFEEYLVLMKEALDIGKQRGMAVVPSCKYHLPEHGQSYSQDEYSHTTGRLLEVWKKVMGDAPMLLEKDFSPTLSGSDRSKDRDTLLGWIENVPSHIKKWGKEGEIHLGLKLMNALFEDAFQVEMVRAVNNSCGADFAVIFNRLFDREKVFEGKTGVAFGGWDLSDRNLLALSVYRDLEYRDRQEKRDIQLSATGNIQSGRMMVEYGLRGCVNGQMHTFFQIPPENFRMRKGTRTQKALHELYFHPMDGLVAAMCYLRGGKGVHTEQDVIRWRDVHTLYKRENLFELFAGGR